MLQRPDGRFAPRPPPRSRPTPPSEDVGAVFFDADGDRRPDLYVVSGGSEAADSAPELQDRLYLNDGRGTFRRAANALPAELAAGSRPVAADYDGDGDVDLFVGGRVVPGQYGVAPQSLLLVNDGRGRFADAAGRLAPGLARVGMVTDAVWQDVDGDRRPDLVVVGEWMPVAVFRNAGGGRLAPLAVPGLERSHGWWNRVVAGDFTGDGRVDFVVGNLGLNTRLQASEGAPATMLVKDFERNGFVQQVVATSDGARSWPLVLRDDLIKSFPRLKTRFLAYDAYARATMADIFAPGELAGATADTAYTFASALVRNDGGGRFTLVPLPREAQVAPVYGLLADDVDRDGRTDLLLAGNFDGFKPDIGRAAAGYGVLLRGDGRGRLRAGRRGPERLRRAGAGARHPARAHPGGRPVRGGAQRRPPAPLPPAAAALTRRAGRTPAGARARRVGGRGRAENAAAGWGIPAGRGVFRGRACLTRAGGAHPALTSRGSASGASLRPPGSARSGSRESGSGRSAR
jgi:hypothetical protein